MGFLSKAWKGIKNGFKKIGKVIDTDFIVFYNKDESDFFLIGKSDVNEYYNSFERYIS